MEKRINPCYVCGCSDYHVLKKGEYHRDNDLGVCKQCGNLFHVISEQRDKEMKDYYRDSYRPSPDHKNLITTTNKLNYIMTFLADFLKDKKGLICGDVGAATGYIPNKLRELGHRATGSEYTRSFRRFSEHYYGVPLTEELEPKHKYDLITLYHVFEHIPEPDKILVKYRDMLSEKGRLLIATPEWLGNLEEGAGSPMADFSYLFHKDHINLFTLKSLQSMFSNAGMIIEKQNLVTYGQTYLLRVAKDGEKVPPAQPEKWQDVVEKVTKQRDAIKAYSSKSYQKAVDLWPRFPEAWLKLIFEVYGKDPSRQFDLFNKIPEPTASMSRVLYAKCLWFNQQRRVEEAIASYKEALEVRPIPELLMELGKVLATDGRFKEAMNCFNQVAFLCPVKWIEAQDWMCKCASSMPSWDEVAEEAVKEKLMSQAKEQGVFKASPRDPVMDEPEKVAK